MGWGANPAGVVWETDPAVDADFVVSLGRGRIANPTASQSRVAYLPYRVPDVDLTVNVQTSQAAAGSWIIAYVRARDAGGTWVEARIEYHHDGNLGLSLYEFSPTPAALDARLFGPYTAGTPTMLRMQVRADYVRAKAWARGAREPEHWQVVGRLAHVLGAGRVGLGSVLSVGNTNTNPEVSWGDLRIANPQQFTVIRAVNDVHKAHTAGTDLRLAYPSAIAL